MRSLFLEQIRSLGPEAPMEGLPRALDGDAHSGELLPPSELRPAVGALLAQVAARVERELPEVLGRAWDQIDSLVLLDGELAAEARRLRAAARALSSHESAAWRAEGVAAGHTLDAAIGLVMIVERRLATLLRLRGEAPLLVDGKPFLDVASLLMEVSRAWV
jgi:hypothetical protein